MEERRDGAMDGWRVGGMEGQGEADYRRGSQRASGLLPPER